MECKNSHDLGKAAERLAEKLGGFEKVLEKLQNDVGDATWKTILKKYQKYLCRGAPGAEGQGAEAMDYKFLAYCGSTLFSRALRASQKAVEILKPFSWPFSKPCDHPFNAFNSPLKRL
jgi:hypothetical protein